MHATESRSSFPVLLYDGECGLCNRVVRFLLRCDARGVVHYAPLQSEAGQAVLRAHGLPTDDFDSLVWVADWQHAATSEIRLRTEGVVAALRACGGAARVLGDIVSVIPIPLRDAGYRAVARWRYRIFGPWQECPLPRAEWRERFVG